jgi:ribosome-associated protein
MGKTAKKTTSKVKKTSTAKPTVKRATKSIAVKATPKTRATAKTHAAAKPRATAKRPATPKRPAKAAPDKQALIRQAAMDAAQYAIEKKATDVRLLDLTGITSMTDFFVIASGDSDRQVKAIAESVIVGMRDKEGMSPWRSEGWDSLKWIIIDFVDFVIHVFQTEARVYYNLERLWGDAPTTEVKDTLQKAKAPRKTKAAVGKASAQIRVISDFKEVGGA